MKSPDHSVSIIGLGNVFLGDDGFGPLGVEIFRCRYECSSNVEVLDLGTPGLDLAPYLYGRELVVIIDAVHTNAPGTVSMFCEDDFVSNRAKLRITGHDPGLWETLTHLRLAESAPSELIVIGVNPEACRFGVGVSDGMLSLASEAAETIAQLLVRRGVACIRRQAPEVLNLWWLPLTVVEEANSAKASADA